MSPYRVWSSVFLFMMVSLWVYFVCHTYVEYETHLEYERRVVQEAKVLARTVCQLPREDVAGHLVDCEKAMHTAQHHAPVMKALETTASVIGSDIFAMITEGVRGASHAAGLLGFIFCVVAYIASLIIRSAASHFQERSKYSQSYFSPSLQHKHQSSVCITNLEDDPPVPPPNPSRRYISYC